MRRIKDFIYNTSDISVVVLIVLIALAIIVWRVDIIITESSGEKDSGIIHSAAVKVVDLAEDLTGKDFAFNDDKPEKDIDYTEDIENSDIHIIGDDPDPVADESFTVNIPLNCQPQDISQALYNAGAITDMQHFTNLIISAGKPINAGTYTIPTGLTPEEVLAELAK